VAPKAPAKKPVAKPGGKTGDKGNRRSTSTAPSSGTSKDKRLAENRSAAYQAGSKTKAAGRPTNPRKAGTATRSGDE
jgi:hypothetical protein